LNRLITIIIATAMASPLAVPASRAQTADKTAAGQQFQLSVQRSEHPQLSRDEIDPQATMRLAAPTQAANTVSFAPPIAVAPAAPVAKPRQVPQQDDDPRAYLRETNVDWSKWIGQLSDRWYFNLRTYEDGLGSEFVTERPALFLFTCYADGRIGTITLHQSSGNGIYDRLQMVALMQAAPVARFPAGTKRTSITLLQGWESHLKKQGELGYVPGSFGKDYPHEKVRDWVMGK
jgi:hypothetical protein